ncbi:NAD(P)-binding domain-containing protein [Bradyrhizobium sp. CSA112]|uniref:NAD(P)-dependent oxidoreductase n=1 Tax=Bradyrhizobium sp. CSA112 TaxID=2699170 RepID=UPI0023B0FA47|nr:NAD(P)-binding domain-containing protein [Bradyrhizobium sp. CSA112]MDE5452029.1 NAD(P)-binding domain-containing protein [Bradyrhizobium sp. CSA112]
MSDATIIGLGEMGSALARALMRADRRVTVWNRSVAKAAALTAEGAALAESASAAVAASPITIICVSDYQAARDILEAPETAAALGGRTLVQLGNGTPNEARDGAAWARSNGISYLDGTILAWPSQIGGAETAILVSGPTQTFGRVEADLRVLAGGLSHTGEAIGEASAMAAAVLSYLMGQWIGLCHGALILEAEGMRVDAYGALLANISPILGAEARHLGEVIQTNDYGSPESSLKTSGSDIIRLVRQAHEAGINHEVPAFAAALFKRAIDAGYGPEEHAALIKILRL